MQTAANPTAAAPAAPAGTDKCVIVIDQDLPLGVIANTAAVLSLSLGKALPDLVGHDLADQGGHRHRGITTAPIPILKSDRAALQALREALKPHEDALTVVDLIEATRTTRSYGEYADRLAGTPVAELVYQGIAVHGSSKLVNRYTGSLGLLR
ncbi:DUF2000 domain-containing protein [Chitinimonas koreensis]|uniref:DUF2000 domain-containing protein n=1 Tax=Chitinimonas koreensis TaxID=356302 RepID=UPI0003F9F691|nr:DUF2000 domain-containing protein [Chitinimonas koreensis]QNM94711.1 DUF2000 domain-containing protein [Chitinimonas koreensis]